MHHEPMTYQLKSGTKLNSKHLKRTGRVHVLQVAITVEGADEDVLHEVGKTLAAYFEDHTRLVLHERGWSERVPAMTQGEQQIMEFERYQ